MYTKHGHQIPGTPVEGSFSPALVVACGGVAHCVGCQNDQTANRILNEDLPALNKVLTQAEIDGLFSELREDNRTLEHSEIQNRFGYHAGTEVTAPQHKLCRQKFAEVAEFLDALLPSGRAKALALTELENAAMWANKAIAEQAPLVTE